MYSTYSKTCKCAYKYHYSACAGRERRTSFYWARRDGSGGGQPAFVPLPLCQLFLFCALCFSSDGRPLSFPVGASFQWQQPAGDRAPFFPRCVLSLILFSVSPVATGNWRSRASSPMLCSLPYFFSVSLPGAVAFFAL